MPVVFVHSFGGSIAHWRAQLGHLRSSRRSVAFDLRAHGLSDFAALDSCSIESLSEDIAAVANGLGIERFVLVGHSMGAAIAIAYAGAHPEQIAGLLLVSAPQKVRDDQAGKIEQIMTVMESDYEQVIESFWDDLLSSAQPEVRAQVKSELGSLDREAGLGMMRGIFEFDPQPALRKYRGPKLAVITPRCEHTPGVRHKEITGTSHWMHMDNPEEFNRLMDEFLSTVK